MNLGHRYVIAFSLSFSPPQKATPPWQLERIWAKDWTIKCNCTIASWDPPFPSFFPQLRKCVSTLTQTTSLCHTQLLLLLLPLSVVPQMFAYYAIFETKFSRSRWKDFGCRHVTCMVGLHRCPIIHRLNPKACVDVANNQRKAIKASLRFPQRLVHVRMCKVGFSFQPFATTKVIIKRFRFSWDIDVMP